MAIAYVVNKSKRSIQVVVLISSNKACTRVSSWFGVCKTVPKRSNKLKVFNNKDKAIKYWLSVRKTG